MRLDVFLHTVPDDAILKELKELKRQNNLIISNQKEIMARQDKINASLEELDAATNEIASDLEALRGEVSEGTVSEESLARLDGAVQRLKAMGQDPAQPIPPAEPGTGTGGGSDFPADTGEEEPEA